MRDTKNAWTEVREGQEKKAVKWNPREQRGYRGNNEEKKNGWNNLKIEL